MTYRVQGGWQEMVIEEYDDLDEAMQRIDGLANDHPEAVFQIYGPGINVARYTETETVEA